jgi:hypothetical protein
MSNSLQLSTQVTYNGNNITVSDVGNATIAISGNGVGSLKSYTAPTSDTAIPLGSVTTPGVLFIINNDPTNYVQVKTAVSGTLIAKLFPGQFALIPLDPSITAPSAISHTASCSVTFCIFDL